MFENPRESGTTILVIALASTVCNVCFVKVFSGNHSSLCAGLCGPKRKGGQRWFKQEVAQPLTKVRALLTIPSPNLYDSPHP